MWIDDQILRRSSERIACEFWTPTDLVVVLGSSNEASRECNVQNCADDGIPVLRRYGGGGTVLLGPGCFVVSVGCWVAHHFRNDHYFRLLNGSVIECLSERWPVMRKFIQRGLSDIALDDRKIAGTSLFRSRNYLLYQASILVEVDRMQLNRYLAHPTKEPDYRKGRAHSDFVMGLKQVEAQTSVSELTQQFNGHFTRILGRALSSELIEPQLEQVPTLLARIAREGIST